ncbi:hypothetical protein [Pseudomonas sp. PB3P13]
MLPILHARNSHLANAVNAYSLANTLQSPILIMAKRAALLRVQGRAGMSQT